MPMAEYDFGFKPDADKTEETQGQKKAKGIKRRLSQGAAENISPIRKEEESFLKMPSQLQDLLVKNPAFRSNTKKFLRPKLEKKR